MAYTSIVVFHVTDSVSRAEAQEIARLASEELVPLLRTQPGFQAYQLVNCGAQTRTAVAVTSWATREQSEAGAQEVAKWTNDNVGRWVASAEPYAGEVVVSS
jgi:heme-degrading monooxygenase HmoA